jgi:hypothetical protein
MHDVRPKIPKRSPHPLEVFHSFAWRLVQRNHRHIPARHPVSKVSVVCERDNRMPVTVDSPGDERRQPMFHSAQRKAVYDMRDQRFRCVFHGRRLFPKTTFD